jgi:hypothetical protein
MQHDDDKRTKFERFVVAGFLIAAVTEVVIVLNDVVDAELFGYVDGFIRAVVVY